MLLLVCLTHLSLNPNVYFIGNTPPPGCPGFGVEFKPLGSLNSDADGIIAHPHYALMFFLFLIKGLLTIFRDVVKERGGEPMQARF